MDFYCVDIETTGLDPSKHGVIAFACVKANLFDASVPLKAFYRWVNPEGMVWTQYCLDLHHEWLRIINKRIKEKRLTLEDSQNPTICANLLLVVTAFRTWLRDECGWEQDAKGKWPSLIAAGKNFGAFDLQFLKSYMGMFAHRSLDPAILYMEKGDKKPPDLMECKARAIERGYGGFESTVVSHDALDDAMDVVKLLQFAFSPEFTKK